MRRDLYWTNLLTRIAKAGAHTYSELKQIDVEEFFLIVMDYEKSLSDG